MVANKKMYKCGIYTSPIKYKQIALAGNYRAFKPLATNDHLASDENLSESINKSNEFKARPLKHWRKQYGNSKDTRQTYHNNTLINSYMKPGSYIVHDNSVCNNEICNNISGTVGIYHNYPTSCDTSGVSFNYITCSNEKLYKYDIPSQARKRTLLYNT